MIARKIHELLKLELSIMLLSSLVLMALTYLLVGSKGIEELIAGYNGNFQTPNLLHYSILFVIAIILWFFYYFFNYRNKEFLKNCHTSYSIHVLIYCVLLAGFLFHLLFFICVLMVGIKIFL